LFYSRLISSRKRLFFVEYTKSIKLPKKMNVKFNFRMDRNSRVILFKHENNTEILDIRNYRKLMCVLENKNKITKTLFFRLFQK
jgi:hypothetical protein